MDSNVVTLIIGMTGILATLIASSMGLYFIAKARRSVFREIIFRRQIDLITKILYKQERITIFAIILAKGDVEYNNQARENIGVCIKEFSEYHEESTAIFPAELWIEVRNLNTYIATMISNYDEEKGISDDIFSTLRAMKFKVIMLSRAVLGVDKLTEESLKLFSSKKEYDDFVNTEIDLLKKGRLK